MTATQLRPNCPDPHAPVASDDPALVALEEEIAGALTRAIGHDLEESSAAGAIRAYVHRLRALDCPPEAVVVHMKRLLARATPEARMSPARQRAFHALREAAILYCIEAYFARGGDGLQPR